jgi:hypothetical protein
MSGSLLRTRPSQSGLNERPRARLIAGAVTPGRQMTVWTPDSGSVTLNAPKEAEGNGPAVAPDSETSAVTVKSVPMRVRLGTESR